MFHFASISYAIDSMKLNLLLLNTFLSFFCIFFQILFAQLIEIIQNIFSFSRQNLAIAERKHVWFTQFYLTMAR